MHDYNETELNQKIDAFLTRKLSERFGSSLRFKVDYLDRTKAFAKMLAHPTKIGTRIKNAASFKRERVHTSAPSRYLTI